MGITLKNYSTNIIQVSAISLYIYCFILNILNKTIIKPEIPETGRI